ncbi:TetR/AcrR family transcriptional regulator [Paenibacillus chibensis]|uniref:TetR/AcrR family transcriptional regulator n=1 Tax=Paenibacillus chibensis TaxID=59846 RepID=UPI0013E39EF4|nr:TetR/AcrR family transcriptional regulator [Paenibacillus chibensis]MEC0369554.1 TetR/AcrR family transcriptional regulator [Paenibacillus chibensis]
MNFSQHGPKLKRPPGRPKRQEQEGTTNQYILKTASDLFMEFGYEPVSLQQIAKVCGVTKASIYYHFENKAQLFTAAVSAMMDKAKTSSQQIMQQQGMPLYDRLVMLAERKLRFPHGDFETILREASDSLSKEQMESIRRSEESIHHVLTVSFTEAIEKGEVRPLHPLLMAHTLASMLMLGNREVAKEFAPSPTELAHDIIDMFWNGVGLSRESRTDEA